jgi:HK97 gp10 family phage protein
MARDLISLRVEVRGLQETIDALNQLPPALRRQPIPDALTDGGQVVLQEEATTVPIKTGRLFRSLEVSSVQTKKSVQVVKVGTTSEGFYGTFLEFGTSRIPARPWMRPALDHAARPALQAFQAILEQAIPAVAAKIEAPKPPLL